MNIDRHRIVDCKECTPESKPVIYCPLCKDKIEHRAVCVDPPGTIGTDFVGIYCKKCDRDITMRIEKKAPYTYNPDGDKND